MKNKNLKLGIITGTAYLSAIIASIAIIAWISTEMGLGGFSRFLNVGYAAGIILGLIIAFACGYSYHSMLSDSVTRYAGSTPDMSLNLVKAICRCRLLSRSYGYTSIATLLSAALIFVLTGDDYIEAVCLLMSIGFTALMFYANYRSQARQLLLNRFKGFGISAE